MKEKIVSLTLATTLCLSCTFPVLAEDNSARIAEIEAQIAELQAELDKLTSDQESGVDNVQINSESDIVFEDVSAFFDSEQNYQTIIENLDNFKIEELKVAIQNYESSHQDDTLLLNAILNILNEYGDIKNLVCETDSFSGETNIYYEGYTGIDSEHYLYPHYTDGKYMLRLGFVQDDWLFAEKIYFKKTSESMEAALRFSGDAFEFERDTLDGGMVMEYKEEELSDFRIDYFSKDMSEETVIRFENDSGEKIDYILTSADKDALQNVAKYSKIRNCLDDIYDNRELYYTDMADGQIISGKMSVEKNNLFQFGVELTNKESEYRSFGYYANFDFLLSNNYDKTIVGINGIGTVLDSQKKRVIALRFDFSDVEIPSGESLEHGMYYECKSYEDIYNIPYEDITFVYTPESVIFSDGTTEEF